MSSNSARPRPISTRRTPSSQARVCGGESPVNDKLEPPLVGRSAFHASCYRPIAPNEEGAPFPPLASMTFSAEGERVSFLRGSRHVSCQALNPRRNLRIAWSCTFSRPSISHRGEAPCARVARGRAAVLPLASLYCHHMPSTLSASSVEARPGRRESCGPITESSVGRGETDDTLQTPERVSKPSVREGTVEGPRGEGQSGVVDFKRRLRQMVP